MPTFKLKFCTHAQHFDFKVTIEIVAKAKVMYSTFNNLSFFYVVIFCYFNSVVGIICCAQLHTHVSIEKHILFQFASKQRNWCWCIGLVKKDTFRISFYTCQHLKFLQKKISKSFNTKSSKTSTNQHNISWQTKTCHVAPFITHIFLSCSTSTLLSFFLYSFSPFRRMQSCRIGKHFCLKNTIRHL